MNRIREVSRQLLVARVIPDVALILTSDFSRSRSVSRQRLCLYPTFRHFPSDAGRSATPLIWDFPTYVFLPSPAMSESVPTRSTQDIGFPFLQFLPLGFSRRSNPPKGIATLFSCPLSVRKSQSSIPLLEAVFDLMTPRAFPPHIFIHLPPPPSPKNVLFVSL